MIRTMVYLPNQLHKSIKHLAVRRETSIAKLVTEALEVLYQKEKKFAKPVTRQWIRRVHKSK